MEKRKKYNKSKAVAIVFAVLFSYWSWLYTYRKDKMNFWAGFLIAIIGTPILIPVGIGYLIPLGLFVWALIDRIKQPVEYYKYLK